MVMWLVGGALLALGLVLLAQVGGYVELRNLATAPALARRASSLNRRSSSGNMSDGKKEEEKTGGE